MGGTRYQVRVSDCFHLFDESHVGTHGTFETVSAAVAACQRIVDEGLEAAHGTTAADLYRSWAQFGDSPWIVASDGSKVAFSASEYARQKAEAMTA